MKPDHDFTEATTLSNDPSLFRTRAPRIREPRHYGQLTLLYSVRIEHKRFRQPSKAFRRQDRWYKTVTRLFDVCTEIGFRKFPVRELISGCEISTPSQDTHTHTHTLTQLWVEPVRYRRYPRCLTNKAGYWKVNKLIDFTERDALVEKIMQMTTLIKMIMIIMMMMMMINPCLL